MFKNTPVIKEEFYIWILNLTTQCTIDKLENSVFVKKFHRRDKMLG